MAKNKPDLQGHHECEIFLGRENEGAESQHNWENCEKNSGHEKFISVDYFVDNCLPKIQIGQVREKYRAWIDLTVRLRVLCTSVDRPDDDDFSELRGTSRLRLGTGFIWYASRPVYNEPCLCDMCDGQVIKKHWRFEVQTAHHVVYNTEEAKETKLDLFYNDESCDRDGRMKSMWGVKVVESKPDRDVCIMLCATHDEELGERINAANRFIVETEASYQDIPFLEFLPPRNRDCFLVAIVSHPHGKPKKITVGELRCRKIEYPCKKYNTPTCRGCSGAPVFMCEIFRGEMMPPTFYLSVHCGSYDFTSTDHSKDLPNFLNRLCNRIRGHKRRTTEEQVNYCFSRW